MNVLKRTCPLFLSAIIAFIMLSLALPVPAEAQGIAISGNFYRNHFKLVPGEKLVTPDNYIVVFNHETTDIRIKLIPQSPSGVQIYLSETDFTVSAGGEQKVEVGVEVSPNATPGEYVLAITADIQLEGEGIIVAGAAQQQAKLTILGEAGEVSVNVVDCQGEHLPAEVHLCRKEDEQVSPCEFSATGSLEARLAPGDYMIHAFYNGVEIANKEFSLQADETVDITVPGRTVFIQGFSVAPNYYEETGEIAFANIVYTINNIYIPLPSTTATLKVSRDGEAVEEEELISLPTLSKGDLGGSYKYVPTQGWQAGTYTFKMELYSEGNKLCGESPEQQLEVAPKSLTPTGVNWTIMGVIIGGIVLVILIIFAVRRRRQA